MLTCAPAQSTSDMVCGVERVRASDAILQSLLKLRCWLDKIADSGVSRFQAAISAAPAAGVDARALLVASTALSSLREVRAPRRGACSR